MAYLDSSQFFLPGNAVAIRMPADFLPAPIQPAGFERTEWAIIALARQDGLATLQPLRQSRLGRLIFGQPRSYALSGERLEVLRRLAVEAWHRPLAMSLPAIGAFMAAGFTSAQLKLLLSTTGALLALSSQIGTSHNPVPHAASRYSK